MKILINDKMQSASGVPATIITPALSDRYITSNTFTATFDDDEIVDCIGIGYTDATEIEIYAPNLDPTELAYIFNYDTCNDSSGNGNDGTATDITYEDSTYGRAAVFNGSSSNIESKDSVLLNTFSVVFNLYTASDPASYYEIASKAKGSKTYETFRILQYTNKSLEISYSDTNTTRSSFVVNNFFELSKYQCTSIEYDGTTLRVYKDNELKGSKTTTIVDSTSIINIGRRLITESNWLDGSMDYFRILNRPLTDAERTNGYENNIWPADDARKTITLPYTATAKRVYNNGLYLLGVEFESDKYVFTHNGSYIGRVGMGEYRTLGTAPAKELGFYTTNESRTTLSGQVIAGAGGYCGRSIDLDVRYKIDETVYNDILTAYCGQISKEYPYFLLLDDEQHKVPATMLHFYAQTDKPISKLQSSSYQFLYSYKFQFRECF